MTSIVIPGRCAAASPEPRNTGLCPSCSVRVMGSRFRENDEKRTDPCEQGAHRTHRCARLPQTSSCLILRGSAVIAITNAESGGLCGAGDHVRASAPSEPNKAEPEHAVTNRYAPKDIVERLRRQPDDLPGQSTWIAIN